MSFRKFLLAYFIEIYCPTFYPFRKRPTRSCGLVLPTYCSEYPYVVVEVGKQHLPLIIPSSAQVATTRKDLSERQRSEIEGSLRGRWIIFDDARNGFVTRLTVTKSLAITEAISTKKIRVHAYSFILIWNSFHNFARRIEHCRYKTSQFSRLQSPALPPQSTWTVGLN